MRNGDTSRKKRMFNNCWGEIVFEKIHFVINLNRSERNISVLYLKSTLKWRRRFWNVWRLNPCDIQNGFSEIEWICWNSFKELVLSRIYDTERSDVVNPLQMVAASTAFLPSFQEFHPIMYIAFNQVYNVNVNEWTERRMVHWYLRHLKMTGQKTFCPKKPGFNSIFV